MQEVLKIFTGIAFLILGFFIGNYLAKITREELHSGQKWFRMIIFISLIGSVVSLLYQKDYYLYTFLFIMIVTSRSLR